MTTLVVGATGLLGLEVCRGLRSAGKSVRALVRRTSDAEKVKTLQNAGADLVYGDLKDPASLAAACRDVKTIVSTASSTMSRQEGDSLQSVDDAGQLALIDAAKRAGVSHFIFVSFSGNVDIDMPLGRAKRGAENALKSSGMTYTILRPSYFMEVWLSPAAGFDYGAGRAQILGSGESRASVISLFDVARYVVGCVDNPAVANAVIELGGPEAVSPREIVHVFEEATGRPFETQDVPEEALEAQWRGAEDPMQKTFAALMLCVARGDVIDNTDALRRVPMKLTSIREYARKVASPESRERPST